MAARKRSNFLAPFGGGTSPQEAKWLTDGWGRFVEVVLQTVGVLATATVGTVKTEPPTPLGLLDSTLAIIKELTPGLPDGPSVAMDPVIFWIGSIRALRRAPDQIALSSAANGTYTMRASFVIPLQMLQSSFDVVSMADLRGRSTARFRWIGPTATQYRDALINGSDGTFTITSISVNFNEFDAVGVQAKQGFEAAWKADRVSLPAAGFTPYDLDIKPGEFLRALWLEVVQGGATLAPSNTLVDQFYMKINGNQDHNSYFVPQQAHNQMVYQVAPASWPTGAVFLDLDEDGKMIALPTPNSSASKIQVFINCPSTPAAGAYARIGYELFRPVAAR